MLSILKASNTIVRMLVGPFNNCRLISCESMFFKVAIHASYLCPSCSADRDELFGKVVRTDHTITQDFLSINN